MAMTGDPPTYQDGYRDAVRDMGANAPRFVTYYDSTQDPVNLAERKGYEACAKEAEARIVEAERRGYEASAKRAEEWLIHWFPQCKESYPQVSEARASLRLFLFPEVAPVEE